MGPPRPRCCLNVGITGHRLNRVDQAELDATTPELERLFGALASTTSKLHGQAHEFFADAPPALRALSGLAEGADRHIAGIASHAGFALQAVLPFHRDDYALDFDTDGSCAEFRSLLARAERVFELPGERGGREHAYEMVGHALVAHSELLVALWDGHAPRGRGGTAAVVALALARGMPVIHVQPGAPVRVLWSGFEPLPVPRQSIDDYPSRRLDESDLELLLARILLPDDSPEERACLAGFFRETERRRRGRIEYPLLLAAAGVGRLGLATLFVPPYHESTRHEWNRYRAAMPGPGTADPAPLQALERAYAWSDNLASHYAQAFRSGHVLNFTLAAVAVLLALSGLVWPAVKFWLIVGELASISLLIANTYVGRARQWHRRWLDYRYLAECLRPMRSLKLYGLVASAARGPAGGERRHWPDWYAESIWRQQGCPAGHVDAAYAARLNRLVADEELAPQIAYHEATARRMHTLEHRLHRLGSVLFGGTIAACVTFLAGYFAAHEWTVARAGLFTVVTAALPALGSAIYGIRVQGDFGGSAGRSERTAATLEELRAGLAAIPAPTMTQASALAESAARVMLADLDEWQITHRQHVLTIPS
jgi:hypothetical protein